MPRSEQAKPGGETLFSSVVEQGWLAFVILGVLMVGLRLYNVHARSQQRQLLRENLMAQLGYGVKTEKRE